MLQSEQTAAQHGKQTFGSICIHVRNAGTSANSYLLSHQRQIADFCSWAAKVQGVNYALLDFPAMDSTPELPMQDQSLILMSFTMVWIQKNPVFVNNISPLLNSNQPNSIGQISKYYPD
jgi:hypothetical protein